MRWVIGAVVVLGLASPACADGFDILRGAVGLATYPRWSGFYAGGQFGYNDENADFSASTQAPIAYVLRNSTLEITSHPSEMPVLGTADHTAASYGGFAGYNTQWQDVIVGVEVNFTHAAFTLVAPNTPIQRSSLSDGAGNLYTVGISGAGSISDLNYGTVRLRAGWIAGNFLPYAFVGFATGVANVNVATNVELQQQATPPPAPIFFTATGGKTGAILLGGAAGAGVDVALTQNLFLRGEFEYLRFAPIAFVPLTIETVRVGGGIKF